MALLCECRTKKGDICNRRSTYNINGKNYCNQHSRPIISKIADNKKYFNNEDVNNIFNEFLLLRKKIKAVNSDRAINTLINKLNNYDDETKYKMIEKSIVNSWKDVYELKGQSAINKVPEWFNKENETQKMTLDDDIEFEKLLKEIGE